jgi:cell division protein FtsI/penicillin-binding protein 2
MNIKKSILLRARIAFLLIVLVSLAAIARIWYLQYTQGERWEKKFTKRDVRFKKFPQAEAISMPLMAVCSPPLCRIIV